MGESLITHRNFKGSELGDTVFATIEVTYPAGSVCSCSMDGNIFTAPDTSGTASFIIAEIGTWTVSCTDGTESSSKTVDITTEGQIENIKLLYKFYIFKQGEGLASSITNQSLYNTHSVSTDQIAIENYYGIHTYASFSPVNVTGYSKMYMHAYHEVNYSEPLRFGIGTAGEGQDAEAEKATEKTTGEGTWELDISSLYGDKSVFVGTNCEYAYVYNWWLEP